MQIRMIVFLTLLFLAFVITADNPTVIRRSGPIPLAGNLQHKAVLLADGSDPMPLCRHNNPNCGQ